MQSQSATLAGLRADPLARGALLTLAGTASVALLLALLGLVLSVVSDVRDDRGELFDLEAQGAAPATIRAHLRLRALLVATFGIAGGLVARRDSLGARDRTRLGHRERARSRSRRCSSSLDLPLLALAAVAYVVLAVLLVGAATSLARPRARPCGGGGCVTAAIELKDVFRVHSTPEGDAAALQGLSLQVAEGEVVTVLGPSGSGKSTLLRLLAGLERPSAGVVRVHGEDLGKLPPRGLARYRSSRLGYADQHYARALAPELTARDLVALQLGLRGTPRGVRLAPRRRAARPGRPRRQADAPRDRAFRRRAAAGGAVRRARPPA